MEDIKKIIVEETEKRKALQTKARDLKFSLDDISMEKKRIEDKIFFEVSSEKDENNKSVYSNETLRKSETSNRVMKDIDYAQLLVKEYETKRELSGIEIELDYLRRRFKSVEYIIDLMKLKRWEE